MPLQKQWWLCECKSMTEKKKKKRFPLIGLETFQKVQKFKTLIELAL